MHLQRARSHRSLPRERAACDDVACTRVLPTSTRRDCAFPGQSRKNPVASLRRGKEISFSLRRKPARVSQTPVGSSRNHSGSQRTLRWLFILRVARSRASPPRVFFLCSASSCSLRSSSRSAVRAWQDTNCARHQHQRGHVELTMCDRWKAYSKAWSWSDGEQLVGLISCPRLAPP